MNNKVIITADDFGVCDRIDEGIIEAIKNQKLTSVSVIVTHFGWDVRVKKLLDLWEAGHEFGIGLHFCITSGNPKAKNQNSPLRHPETPEVFRTVQNYNFYPSSKKDVAEELEAQFQEICKMVPREKLDHLTNHHNIVYAHEEFYSAFIEGAHNYAVPIRTPMSWYRKFKKFQPVPDYEGGDMLNPTMRRGIKIGMWRKLGKMSYGNLIKRMGEAENVAVNYPDVLCEYIYGQCDPTQPEGQPGGQVIAHALYQMIRPSKRASLNKERAKKDLIPVDSTGIHYANEHTLKKAIKLKKHTGVDDVVERYASKKYTKDFSLELIFHLAIDASTPTDEERKLHGINADYFMYRNGELNALMKTDLKELSELIGFELVPFKKL